MKTDVFRLLDQSRTREKTLNDYADVLMKKKMKDTKFPRKFLLISLMEVRFNNAVEAKMLYETRFFESLKNLRGRSRMRCYRVLLKWGKKRLKPKRFHALTKLLAYYETVLKWVSARRTHRIE